MKPVRILSPTLDLLAEIDDYESLIFTRRWHKPGEFALRINRHKKDTDKLQKGNLVLLGSDTNKVSLIKHREIALDENGKESEQWLIRGPDLSGITKQRIIYPPVGQAYDDITEPAETVMKHYVEVCLVNPVDPFRKIDMLTLATDQARGQILSWQSRFKPLDEELEAISISSGLGWGVYVDIELMKWVFEVYEGRDLTAGQAINPPVIFSTDFDNIKTQHFADSDLNFVNFAYVAGQGEGVDRTIVTVPESSNIPSGLGRIETFIDARDIAITEDLVSRGTQKLAEMQNEQLFEAQILPNGPFQYEKDWNLGDIVTVQSKEWGVTMDARITEVREIYESDGFKLEVTFGNSWPTLIDKLKHELKQMSAEVRR